MNLIQGDEHNHEIINFSNMYKIQTFNSFFSIMEWRGGQWRLCRSVNLGTTVGNLLRFSSNTEEILKECHQRQCLLWKIKSFEVNKDILITFYYAFKGNVITLSFIYWFHSINLLKRNRLLNTVKGCSEITWPAYVFSRL